MMKRRVTKTVWQILTLMLVILLPAMTVFAQGGDFTEDFEDSELPGWEMSPDVIIVDGALRVSAGNFAFKLGEWSDYILTLRVRTNGPGDVNLHYYARDESRYQIHILPEEIILNRTVGDRDEILGATNTEAITTGNWVDLSLRIVNGVHEISIEDELVLTATDPEPLLAGPIGLVFHGEGYAEFDDLVLTQEGTTAEGGPLLGGGDQPPTDGEPPPEAEVPPPEAEPTPEGQADGSAEQPTGIQGWLQDFLTGQAQPLELQAFIINLLLSAILAFILGRVYIFWGTSLSNRRKFAANFMLITITTTFIILVVRTSVALSLGLVGALSIVRFRAAIKEPEELAYLFFAIGIGIGLGDNQRLITIVAMAIGVVLIGVLRLFHLREEDMNLHLTVASGNPETIELDSVMGVLGSHAAKLKLLRFDETANAFESTFLVEFQDLEKMNAARKALRKLSPKLAITFMDNRGLE